MTLQEKVAKARKKAGSSSAVILYSVSRQYKFGVFPAKICPDGLPQLVVAYSPKQVQQYKDYGYEVYKEAKIDASLQVAETEAPKRTRKSSQDEQ